MNLENLACFIQVAENLSFARAAEALHISQPAVTKQINTLERELGVSLFVRSTRHVELTPAGMSFYRDARGIVAKTQQAVSRLKNRNANLVTLRIGVCNPSSLPHLSPILKAFHSQYPDIDPAIVVPGYKIATKLFLDRMLDLLFFYRENMPDQKGVLFRKLIGDRLVCLLPEDHPLAEKSAVSLGDIAQYPIIAFNPLKAPPVIAAFQHRLLAAQPSCRFVFCEEPEVAQCMAEAGIGIAVLPESQCRTGPSLTSVPLEETVRLSFGMFYHQNSQEPALEQFLRCAAKFLPFEP